MLKMYNLLIHASRRINVSLSVKFIHMGVSKLLKDLLKLNY